MKYLPKMKNTPDPCSIYVKATLTNVTKGHCVTLMSIPSNRIAASNYTSDLMDSPLPPATHLQEMAPPHIRNTPDVKKRNATLQLYSALTLLYVP